MIFLKKVSNKKDLRNFVIFPFELYKGSKYWIPPIINQEMNNFNKDLNPNLTLIVLIDEAMAHFDEKHREKLFDELLQLNSQVWYTGVSKELFKSISEQTVFFEVKNNI